MAAAANAANAAGLLAQQAQIDHLLAVVAGLQGNAAPGGAALAPVVPYDAAHNAAMLAIARRNAALPPKEFRGVTTGMESHRWMQGIELYFEEAGIATDVDRLRAAGRVLVGPAATWWESERARTANDPALITSWAQFTAALRKRYEPVDISLWGRQQLSTLTGKGMTNVPAYTEQFQELVSLLPDMGEADRIFYYRSGLPVHLRTSLAAKADVLLTLQATVEAAIRTEASRASNGTGTAAPPGGSGQRNWPPRGGQRPAGVSQIEAGGDDSDEGQPSLADEVRTLRAQLNAVQTQHRGASRDQPGKHRTPGIPSALVSARLKAQLCINCGKPGHFARECTGSSDTTSLPPK
jgi:Retrotransposon gag protein/Zinc knuckle